MDERTQLARERAAFRTRLTRRGPSPQPFTRFDLPEDARELTYRSSSLALRAWINGSSSTPTSPRKCALFLHSGFSFDRAHWAAAAVLRERGWLTMLPILRGENGQPGDFSLYYDEVDDVLAARAMLDELPEVDRSRVVVVGYSAGAVLAMLAAQMGARFHKLVVISGWPELQPVLDWYPEYRVFAEGDPREVRLRSPGKFAADLRDPMRVYFGSRERQLAPWARDLVTRARAHGVDAESIVVPGDHLHTFEPAMQHALAWLDR